MNRVVTYLSKAILVFGSLVILMTIAWDLIFPGRIYYCTDEIGFDFLSPGDWVHGEFDIVSDVAVTTSRTMSEPDVLLEGWTIGSLWMVWGCMFLSSFSLALFLARYRWLSSGGNPGDQDGQKQRG